MLNITIRLLRTLRRRRSLGVAVLLLALVVSIVGNALTFFFFERGANPDLTVADAFWYSVISISTIGYGDLSATTAGARIGTVFFTVVLGLTAFTSAVGVGVEGRVEPRRWDAARGQRIDLVLHQGDQGRNH